MAAVSCRNLSLKLLQRKNKLSQRTVSKLSFLCYNIKDIMDNFILYKKEQLDEYIRQGLAGDRFNAAVR